MRLEEPPQFPTLCLVKSLWSNLERESCIDRQLGFVKNLTYQVRW